MGLQAPSTCNETATRGIVPRSRGMVQGPSNAGAKTSCTGWRLPVKSKQGPSSTWNFNPSKHLSRMRARPPTHDNSQLMRIETMTRPRQGERRTSCIRPNALLVRSDPIHAFLTDPMLNEMLRQDALHVWMATRSIK